MKFFNARLFIYFAGGLMGLAVWRLDEEKYWMAGIYYLISVVIYAITEYKIEKQATTNEPKGEKE